MHTKLFFRTNKDEKRGGKICLTVHFKPLWAKNVPHFGIAHVRERGRRTPSANPCAIPKNVPHFGIAHGLALGVRLPRSLTLVDATLSAHSRPLVVGTLACC